MEWNYKNIIIHIGTDGKFYFTNPNKNIEYYSSLEEAEHRIDYITKEYFYFTKDDFRLLYKKINPREKEFIKNIIDELEIHRDNAYCEIGLSDNLKFNWDYKR